MKVGKFRIIPKGTKVWSVDDFKWVSLEDAMKLLHYTQTVTLEKIKETLR